MKASLLTLLMLGGLTVCISDATTNTISNEKIAQIKERMQRMNDMKEQMAQMNMKERQESIKNMPVKMQSMVQRREINMQDRAAQMQMSSTTQMAQQQNMTQQQAGSQLENMLSHGIYAKNDGAYIDWPKKR